MEALGVSARVPALDAGELARLPAHDATTMTTTTTYRQVWHDGWFVVVRARPIGVAREATMNVGELMTTDVISAAPQTAVLDAMDLMDSGNIRHLPVVDGERVVGIVSDRDLARFARRALAARRSEAGAHERARVVDVMTGEPQCVAPDDDIDEVIASMLDTRIGAMPVVDPDGRLLGIVSVVDVLRAAVGRL